MLVLMMYFFIVAQMALCQTLSIYVDMIQILLVLQLYNPVCVGPRRKPRKHIISRCVHFIYYFETLAVTKCVLKRYRSIKNGRKST